MTYFHTGIRTIIGAKAFHCHVRDGKEWYHLAMVVRHNGLLTWHMPGGRIHRVASAHFDCCQRHGLGHEGISTFVLSHVSDIKVIGSSRTGN